MCTSTTKYVPIRSGATRCVSLRSSSWPPPDSKAIGLKPRRRSSGVRLGCTLEWSSEKTTTQDCASGATATSEQIPSTLSTCTDTPYPSTSWMWTMTHLYWRCCRGYCRECGKKRRWSRSWNDAARHQVMAPRRRHGKSHLCVNRYSTCIGRR